MRSNLLNQEAINPTPRENVSGHAPQCGYMKPALSATRHCGQRAAVIPLGPGEQEPSFITEENNCLAIFWFGYDGYLHAVRWDQDS